MSIIRFFAQKGKVMKIAPVSLINYKPNNNIDNNRIASTQNFSTNHYSTAGTVSFGNFFEAIKDPVMNIYADLKGNDGFLPENQQDKIMRELCEIIDKSTKTRKVHDLVENNPIELSRKLRGLYGKKVRIILSDQDKSGNTPAHTLATKHPDIYYKITRRLTIGIQNYLLKYARNGNEKPVAHCLAESSPEIYFKITKKFRLDMQQELLELRDELSGKTTAEILKENMKPVA